MKPIAWITIQERGSVAAIWVLALSLSIFPWTGQLTAQPTVCPTETERGFPQQLPPLPEQPPRPASGPDSVASFGELSIANSIFEVIAGQARILTVKADLSVPGKPQALIAVGDPSILDFTILNTRQIRLVGQRIGVTDLAIITPSEQTYTFEVHVVADLHVLRSQLHTLFPDADIKLAQIREHIVVEGQARDSAQVNRIIETIQAYLVSLQTGLARSVGGGGPRAQGGPAAQPQPPPREGERPAEGEQPPPAPVGPEAGGRSVEGTIAPPQIINLLKVPGSQQVLLKVRIAELNRSALRRVGSDILVNAGASNILGTQIGGNSVTASALATGSTLSGAASLLSGPNTTAFAVFDPGDFAIFFTALRSNSLLKVLAEPNLVALNGHTASFLAGGEFPVPVATTTVGGGSTPNVQFREFGVRLGFLATILDHGVIRLVVDPEVSNIDRTLSTVLVPGGTPVPGLDTRKAHTVVELREGQTLAIAGLLQVTLDGTTDRIPGLGGLPILGPFFSLTDNTRTEKELLVLVTPYLVEPMNPGEVPPSPGDEVNAPNDLEFYFLNRLEGRTGKDFRATTEYENRLPLLRCLLRLDAENVHGPHGYCK
jgi:pilus assembly protein CpaC